MLLYDLILTVLERSGSVYSVYSESHSLKTWTHPRLSCQMKVGRLTSETMFFFPMSVGSPPKWQTIPVCSFHTVLSNLGSISKLTQESESEHLSWLLMCQGEN